MSKISQKINVAGAVFAVLAGASLVTSAQADSLLAPLVVNTTNYETYFAFKMKGATGADGIHYTWIKKGTVFADLARLNKPCIMENNMGKGSKGDMIFQSARGFNRYYNNTVPADGSTPAGYNAGNFVGMTVIDDVANLAKGHSTEGDSSGFAYIVNTATGLVQDYKLLNNHRSSDSGDFGAGFISKHVVDFAWMSGTNPFAPAAGLAPATGWTVSVTGADMTKHSGTYNSTYGVAVKISQAQRAGEDSPQAIMGGGVVNNDETVISGDKPVTVTCMGSLTRADLLSPLQLAGTVNGGWARKSIVPQTDAYAGTDTPKTAKGAFVFRGDFAIMPNGLPNATMQAETGGHLSPGNNHANRPY